MPPRKSPHTARSIQDAMDKDGLSELAKQVKFIGAAVHKRNPGDFGFSPQARNDKTLCDEVGITTRSEAQRLVREGVLRGLISKAASGQFPRVIWAVKDGRPLEARIDNQTRGTYHGYPFSDKDEFGAIVLRRWSAHDHAF